MNLLFAWYKTFTDIILPILNFSERTRDREVVIYFKVPTCTQEELREGDKKYEKAMNATQVCQIK